MKRIKKQFVWMMAAILTLCGTVTLTSCTANEDSPVENPITDPNPYGEALEGVWYCAYPAEGNLTHPNYDEDMIHYDHIVEVYEFHADGTGAWDRLFFNNREDGEPVDNFGGCGPSGAFNYATTPDGTITLSLSHREWEGIDADFYAPQTRTMRLMEQQTESGSAEQKIYGKGIGGTDIAFERDTVGLAVIFDKWNDYLHMGGSDYMHILRLDPDVDDVEYTVTQDVQRDIDATLKAILGDVNTMSAITNAVIEELKENGMPTATTGAVTTLPTGYRSVDYTYESVDELGKPIVLSARAVWGGYKIMDYFKETRADYILLAPHYTICNDSECPTSGYSIEDLIMAGDNLLIIPDYEGFGVTKDRVQPYVVHELCAQQCIDALKAGYKIYRDLSSVPLETNFTLSVAGVSQGGGNALAVHKWLDTHPDFAERWNFDFSYCGAGPYCPRITYEKYFEQKKLVYPIVMPLTLKAMFAAYPDILGKWKEEDCYNESYLAHKAVIDEMINSKKYTTTEINGYFFNTMYPHQGEEGIEGGKEVYLSDFLSDDILNMESDLTKALFECLDKNDLTTGWTPIHPIHLYHGKGDNIVNYANSEAVMQAFPDKADLISPQSDDDHIGTTLQWFMTILFNMWRIIY